MPTKIVPLGEPVQGGARRKHKTHKTEKDPWEVDEFDYDDDGTAEWDSFKPPPTASPSVGTSEVATNPPLARTVTAMPLTQGSGEFRHEPNDVMVSYSRTNKPFCQKVVQFLRDNGIDPWIDWEDIPPSVDWWVSIQQGIQGAYAVVIIMSPKYLESAICHKEVDEAIKCAKLIVPVVYIEVDYQTVRKDLASRNWIFIRDGIDDQQRGFDLILESLHTDFDYVHDHSHLYQRALEWSEKLDDSMLLRDGELDRYQQLIFSGMGKEPPPATLQIEYVEASQDEQQKRKRRERRRLMGLLTLALIGFIVSLALFFVARAAQIRAVAAEKEATANWHTAVAAKAAETAAKVEAIAARDEAVAAKAAETVAKNQAIASEAAAVVARDQAVAAKAAETVAKNEALAAKAAETVAKDEAIAARDAETAAKNQPPSKRPKSNGRRPSRRSRLPKFRNSSPRTPKSGRHRTSGPRRRQRRRRTLPSRPRSPRPL
jgi:cytoskeletal protein RodZ